MKLRPIIALLLCLAESIPAQEIEIDEMVMKTEVGELILTTEPCEFIKMGLKDYPYAAYSTEQGRPHHEGCWKADVVDRFSAILVYFPEIDSTAVYNPKLFKPRNKKDIKGNVFLEPKFDNNKAMLYLGYRF